MKSRMRIILVYCVYLFIAISNADTLVDCQNRGYKPVSSDTAADTDCICPVGYYGQYCEAFTETYRPEKLFNNQKPKLIAVVNTIYDVFGALDAFRNGILADPALKNDYYKEYYLYLYNSGPPTSTQTFTGKQQFIDELSKLTSITASTCINDTTLLPSVLNFLQTNKFSETVINIFTQLPTTNAGLIDLQETALAFNVQINVFFAYSPVICGDHSIDVSSLRSLAERTGGIFVPYSYDNNAYVGDLASLSSSLQLVNYAANRHGGSATVQFVPVFSIYNVFLTSANGTATLTDPPTGAIVKGKYTLSDEKTVLYVLVPTSNARINVAVTSTIDEWSVQIVAKGNIHGTNPTGIRVYTTFTDRTDVDTTYNYLKSGVPAYARIHVENLKSTTESISLTSIAVFNEDSIESISSSEIDVHDSSTFEYITNSTVECVAATTTSDGKPLKLTKQWIRLDYTIGGFGQVAYVPFKCLDSTSDKVPDTNGDELAVTLTTESTSSTTEGITATESTATSDFESTTAEVTTTNAPTTTEIPTTTIPTPERGSLPSIVIGFSYKYSVQQRAALLRGPALLDKDVAETYFNNFLVTPFDVKDYGYSETVKRTHNYDEFIQQVQSVSWNNNDYTPTENTVKETLLAILNDADVTPRSFVTLLVDSKASFEPNVEILQLATSKQIRIVFVVDLSYLSSSFIEEVLASENHNFYNQLASVTDGHLIYTQVDVPNPLDGTVSLEDVFADLHTNAFSKKLVLSYIADYGQTVYKCGQLDLRGLTGTRQLTLTASYTDKPVTPGFTSIVSFIDTETSKISMATADYTSRNFKSNLVSANLNFIIGGNITTGALYNVSIRSTISDDVSATIVYRLWQEVTEEDFGSVSVQYKDLAFANVPGPNEEYSAISEVTIHDVNAEISSVDVDFYDANGVYVNTFDNFHTAVSTSDSSKVFDVSPFVCSGRQNTTVTTVDLFGLYTVKYTVNLKNNLTWVQNVHFWCDVPANPTPTTAGDDGCLTHGGPHYRGPYCNILECSNNGHVFYNHSSTKFQCQCSDGYEGSSCEIGLCEESSSIYTSTTTNTYTTATFGFIYATRVQLNAFLDELTTLLNLEIGDNVKHYNFYSSCDGQTFKTIYFGTSKAALITAIQSVKSNAVIVADSCGTITDVDITEAVKYGLQSVSRDVRGLIWIAAGNGNPYIADLEDTYYSLVQGFRQELYLTVENIGSNATVFEDIVNSVRVTGGELLFIKITNTGKIAAYLSKIILQPTSLNAYAYNETVDNVIVEVASLVTITSFGSAEPSLTNCESLYSVTNGNTKIYTCESGVAITVDASDLVVSVRALGGFSPLWTFVNETKQDALESLPVLSSYPTVAFSIAQSETLTYKNISDVTAKGYTRFARRQDKCNFLYTSTYQTAVTELGYHNFEFEVESNSDKYKKVIPFVVTRSLEGRCKNGFKNEKENDARCTCVSDNGEINWNGPDCSRPICQNGGTLNVFQNACNCPADFGGPTCLDKPGNSGFNKG